MRITLSKIALAILTLLSIPFMNTHARDTRGSSSSSRRKSSSSHARSATSRAGHGSTTARVRRKNANATASNRKAADVAAVEAIEEEKVELPTRDDPNVTDDIDADAPDLMPNLSPRE